MKIRFIKALLAAAVVSVGSFALSGCDTDGGGHTAHTFDRQLVEEIYLKSKADCTHRAVYYYSCECGEKGTTTFEYGELTAHVYENGKCKYCETEQPFSVGLRYSLNSDETAYTVTGIGSCADSHIRIPKEYEDKPVTGIGSFAFSGCRNLTGITIPESVEYIGGYAFMDCSGITCVIIGGGVTSIGNDAFYDCFGLSDVTIPESVTSMGFRVFSGCVGLETIYCETAEKPNGWDSYWHANCTANVIWGYAG